MIRPIAHLVLHGLVPGVVARFAFKANWRRAWLIMVATLLIDLDHLLVTPVYDPNRCSIGFHPLHSRIAIGIYAVMVAIPRFRLVGIGLLIHILLDAVDCAWMRWE